MLTKQDEKARAQLDSGDEEFAFEGIEDDDDISNASGPRAPDPLPPSGSQGAPNILYFFTKIETGSSTNAKETLRACKLCR